LKKSSATIFFSLILCIILLAPASCTGGQLERFEETRSLMDTFVTVVIYASPDTGQESIDAAFDRMEEIETIATTWDSEGEAYRLNETGCLASPSEELSELIETSLEYNEITDGCFDITVQPLLDLWEYDPEAEKQFWEMDESDQLSAIDTAMKLVGSDHIILDGNSIKLKEGSSITLGGIAKGYAADKALQTLKSLGIKHALINAGGDIRTLGTKPGGKGWEIALVNPDDTTQSLAGFVVDSMAVTTSGNYERYFNPDKSAHHIINPKTGFSADECISVTIIAESGTQADALATGVFVLGPDDGMDLVEELDDVEALIVDTSRNIHQSSGLSQYMVKE
jgi:thiamine biosynthesis lipoprotein